MIFEKITFPEKKNGDTFTAAELDEIKDKFNALVDALNLTLNSPEPETIKIISVIVS